MIYRKIEEAYINIIRSVNSTHIASILLIFFILKVFTSIPTALTANDRNRMIQVYQASDG